MPSSIKLNLYCDEIKKTRIIDPTIINQEWIYIGILIVPTNIEDNLIEKLNNLRCGNPEHGIVWGKCNPVCEYHKKNNCEVHYKKLRSFDVYYIAKRWIDFLIKDGNYTFFYILGILLTNLDFPSFGQQNPSERLKTIYNRFFRTAILKSVKSYFSQYQSIIIENIVHDDDDIKNHLYFPWHSIYRIESEDPKVTFNCSEIEFIDSNHITSDDPRSNLIQYIDLIIGSIYNALHWESQNSNKEKISLKILPLLDRMLNNPNNKSSRYNYYKRKGVDFFPNKKIRRNDEFEVIQKGSLFKKREIRIKRKYQSTLF